MYKDSTYIVLRVNKKGYVQYKADTSKMRWYDIKRWTSLIWNYIWVVSSKHVSPDEQTNWVLCTEMSCLKHYDEKHPYTYAELKDDILSYNTLEFKKFCELSRNERTSHNEYK